MPSYYIPGIVLGVVYELIQLILTVALHAKYPIIPILQMRKLKHKKLSSLPKPTKVEVNLCSLRLLIGDRYDFLVFTDRKTMT